MKNVKPILFLMMALSMTGFAETTKGKSAICNTHSLQPPQNHCITMTFDTEEIPFGRNIAIAGSGLAIVDFGDGFERLTIRLKELPMSEIRDFCFFSSDDGWWFELGYPSGHDETTITITGNITGIAVNRNFDKICALDVSRMPGLKVLDCSKQHLTSLDVSKNRALVYLDCSNNRIDALDVSRANALVHLDCRENYRIGSIDLSGCKGLERLNCASNRIASLAVGSCAALQELNISYNRLDEAAINAILDMLPVRDVSWEEERFPRPLNYYGNPGADSVNIKRTIRPEGWAIVIPFPRLETGSF